jgi:hypothetical protein
VQNKGCSSGNRRAGYCGIPTNAWNGENARGAINVAHRLLAQSKEGQDSKDNDDQPHQVDDTVHRNFSENLKDSSERRWVNESSIVGLIQPGGLETGRGAEAESQ